MELINIGNCYIVVKLQVTRKARFATVVVQKQVFAPVYISTVEIVVIATVEALALVTKFIVEAHHALIAKALVPILKSVVEAHYAPNVKLLWNLMLQ
ncbi:hypothetical protein Plhal304r1_c021g0075591 [Plasmopara halstedii]